MDDLEFVCKYDGHDEEQIIGFCLNQQCQMISQICLKCCWDKHGDHEDDCKTFKQISKLLTKNKKLQPNQNDEVINKLKEIQSKSEKLCSSKNIGYEKLDEFEKNLSEKQYENCLGNIQVLKNFINSQNKNNDKQLESIYKALNNLGIPQVEKIYISQSSNTDTQINQVEKKEIQVNIEVQNISGQTQQKSQIQQSNIKDKEIEITYEKQSYPKQTTQQTSFLSTDFQKNQEKSPYETSQQFGVNPSQIFQNPVQQHTFLIKFQNPNSIINILINARQLKSNIKLILNIQRFQQYDLNLLITLNSHSLNISSPQTINFFINPKITHITIITTITTIVILKYKTSYIAVKDKFMSSILINNSIVGCWYSIRKRTQKIIRSINIKMIENPQYQNKPPPEINLSSEQLEYYKKICSSIPSYKEVDLLSLINFKKSPINSEELQQVLNSCEEALSQEPFKYEFNFKKCCILKEILCNKQYNQDAKILRCF